MEQLSQIRGYGRNIRLVYLDLLSSTKMPGAPSQEDPQLPPCYSSMVILNNSRAQSFLMLGPFRMDYL